MMACPWGKNPKTIRKNGSNSIEQTQSKQVKRDQREIGVVMRKPTL